MTLLRGVIQRKLSAALGAVVEMGDLRVSPIKGTVDALDVSVTAGRAVALRVPRIKADVSFSRALHKEIAIKSVVLERPVLRVVQGEDGTLRLPAAQKSGNGNHGWTSELGRVLLVDGEIRFTSHWGNWAGYEFAAAGVLAELLRTPTGYKFTVIMTSPARLDRSAALGEIKALGEITLHDAPARTGDASLIATIDLGPTLNAKLTSPSLSSRRARLEFKGDFELARLFELLPATLPWLDRLRGSSGRARIDAAVAYGGGKLEIKRMELGLHDATLGPAAAVAV